MNSRIKNFLFFFIGSFGMFIFLNFFSNQKIEYKSSEKAVSQVTTQSIDELTKETVVVAYLKKEGKLPDCYITKAEAKSKGWEPSKGNLCEVLPGRAIGGDVWTNRQESLPSKQGRIYLEADLNYNCGNRNADRVVFSNDGLIFVTHDHYKSFQEK
jgi:hypothetical protein